MSSSTLLQAPETPPKRKTQRTGKHLTACCPFGRGALAVDDCAAGDDRLVFVSAVQLD